MKAWRGRSANSTSLDAMAGNWWASSSMGRQFSSGAWRDPRSIAILLGAAVWLAALWMTLPGGDPIRFAAGAVSSQRATHSFASNGHVFAFDARMFGVYLAFLCMFTAMGGGSARDDPSVTIVSIACLLGLFVALDGVNSLLDDRWQWSLYPPSNVLRFLAGMSGGTCVALIIRELSRVTWPSTASGASGTLIAASGVCATAIVSCLARQPRLLDVLGLLGAVTLYSVLALLITRIFLAAPGDEASWPDVAVRWPGVVVAVISGMLVVATLRGAYL